MQIVWAQKGWASDWVSESNLPTAPLSEAQLRVWLAMTETGDSAPALPRDMLATMSLVGAQLRSTALRQRHSRSAPGAVSGPWGWAMRCSLSSGRILPSLLAGELCTAQLTCGHTAAPGCAAGETVVGLIGPRDAECGCARWEVGNEGRSSKTMVQLFHRGFGVHGFPE